MVNCIRLVETISRFRAVLKPKIPLCRKRRLEIKHLCFTLNYAVHNLTAITQGHTHLAPQPRKKIVSS